jgi:hypothetical protein
LAASSVSDAALCVRSTPTTHTLANTTRRHAAAEYVSLGQRKPHRNNQMNDILKLSALLISLFLLIGIPICYYLLYAGKLDRQRIADDANKKGWKIKSIIYSPLALGLFGRSEERLYRVVVFNKDGKRMTKVCKTCLMKGVFWS